MNTATKTLAQKIVGEIRRTVTQTLGVDGSLRRTDAHHRQIWHRSLCCLREVELVHGPGCPVCVTSLEMIDKAHAIARRPDVIFCSFGDMLRVPGSESDLLSSNRVAPMFASSIRRSIV